MVYQWCMLIVSLSSSVTFSRMNLMDFFFLVWAQTVHCLYILGFYSFLLVLWHLEFINWVNISKDTVAVPQIPKQI